MQMRYKEVPTCGKVRPMGIPSCHYDLLAPLHKAIYGHLSSKDWLLVGPPTEKRIGKICTNRFQTSIDLTNATDGLRLDATEAILGSVLSKASSIPGIVRKLAFDSLRAEFVEKKRRVGEVTHGQMMGTYLSFPLLCLSSYCAAMWAARDDKSARILVNGDDVLISSRFKLVKNNYDEGFCVNMQKTGVFERVAEINSTCFAREGNRWKEVRHLRRGGGVVDEVEGVQHLATACKKAGGKWISAFINSRIGKRHKVRPSELGLPLSNRECWQRETSLRDNYCILYEDKGNKTDERLEATYDEPLPEERECLREFLFNHGRMDRKREVQKRRYLNRCKIVRCRSSRGLKTTTGRSFGGGLTYVTPAEEEKINRLLEERRGPPRKILGFLVREWNPTENYRKYKRDGDGVTSLGDPDQWW
jgi:hypothetical protein